MQIMQHIDLWQFMGGLGIFLFGMSCVEDALRQLAGAPFKRFLRDRTRTPLQGILSGTIITAVLQSSSLVTLMLLAFVGAGIMNLQNALGVILGSNLGTTFTGWLVTSLGFKLDIESFALPGIALGSLLATFSRRKHLIYQLSMFLIGFGFLFLGLGYMKEAIESISQIIDLTSYRDYHPYLLFPVGLVLTALIQSSSATMVIVLSALHAEILSLPAAAAMIVGADLGTTVTAILGSIGGSAQKKQVAMGHVIFNLIADVLALLFLFPILDILLKVTGDQQPLYTLVLFHSSFNFLGIALVAPFLGKLAFFLQKRFPEAIPKHARYIVKVSTEVPEASLKALESEVRELLAAVFILNLQAVGIRDSIFRFPEQMRRHPISSKSYLEQYEDIKELEGEIVDYCLELQARKLELEQSNRVSQLTLALRSAVLSAKALKDIRHNLLEFEHSANDILLELLDRIRGQMREVYLSIDHICVTQNVQTLFESLLDTVQQNKRNYEALLGQIHEQIRMEHLGKLETSTFLNVNFEIYNSTRTLVSAIKDLMLSREQAVNFSNLPEMR